MSRVNMVKCGKSDWRREAMEQLEEASDKLLSEQTGDGARCYTEKQLSRKIRLEDKRLPVSDGSYIPSEAYDYLLHSQMRLMVEGAKLTKLQASALELALLGYKAREIAEAYGISAKTIESALRAARSKLSRSRSPYDGLYEVYWSEVHRYVYRKK